jgi:hypothetical protein
MSRPSPLHRDPDEDGGDFGCYGETPAEEAANNRLVAELVARLEEACLAGAYETYEDLVAELRAGLRRIPGGATDTVVKENCALALEEVAEGLPGDRMAIYGW